METVKPPLSIEQYAAFILADERVVKTLNKIEASNRMADHFLTLPSDGTVRNEDLLYAEGYRKAIRRTKEKNVLDIMRKSVPSVWLFVNNIREIAYNVIAGQPSFEDLSIIMLWHFVSHPEFRQFLVTDEVPYLNNSTPLTSSTGNILSSERRLQFVFALFLWLEMDAQYDSQTGRTYYVKAQDEAAIKSMRDKKKASTVTGRKRFIGLFKDYIHAELWTSEDYNKEGKQGIVLRLRLTDSVTGQVVIQECGEKIGTCNKLILITPASTEMIVENYLNTGKLLRSSQETVAPLLSFQCAHCGNPGASHFMALAEPIVFYCDMNCYCGK